MTRSNEQETAAAAQHNRLPADENDRQAEPIVDQAEPEAVDELQRLRLELERAQDRILRIQAELENVRKRSRREIDEERRYANLPLMRDLLPVLDNVARALEAAEKAAEASGVVEGFRMVVDQLQGVLKQHHCTPVSPLHEAFDPNVHEAVSQQPSDEHPAGTVVHVARDGYQLYDRVIRPAQVIVSGPPPQAVDPPE